MTKGLHDEMMAILSSFEARHGRMPTMKELEGLTNRTHSALKYRLASLRAAGRIKVLPRGTLPIAIVKLAPAR